MPLLMTQRCVFETDKSTYVRTRPWTFLHIGPGSNLSQKADVSLWLIGSNLVLDSGLHPTRGRLVWVAKVHMLIPQSYD